MKNVFFLITMLAFVLLGCKTPQPVMTQQPLETPSSTATQKPPTRWYQSTYPGIAVGDPINFFNEYQIEVSAKIPKKVLVMQDGTTYYVDSSTVVNMMVPKLTPGILKEVKKENGLPTRMKISFDEGNQDYTLSFFLYSDKSFVLDANCVVTYENKKYKTQAFIRGGDKSGLNHLLSNFETIESLNKVESSAGGVNAVGTKVIKNE